MSADGVVFFSVVICYLFTVIVQVVQFLLNTCAKNVELYFFNFHTNECINARPLVNSKFQRIIIDRYSI